MNPRRVFWVRYRKITNPFSFCKTNPNECGWFLLYIFVKMKTEENLNQTTETLRKIDKALGVKVDDLI